MRRGKRRDGRKRKPTHMFNRCIAVRSGLSFRQVDANIPQECQSFCLKMRRVHRTLTGLSIESTSRSKNNTNADEDGILLLGPEIFLPMGCVKLRN